MNSTRSKKRRGKPSMKGMKHGHDDKLEYSKMRNWELYSDLMFGYTSSYLPLVDMEDESFTSWYRKTAGMHTVETWLSNYKRHPYAWGALIMIHGVNEVSARLRSKVENYAVYSAVLLSASVVLFAFTEINQHFDEAHWVLKRIYLYALCVSVSSHMCSILLSMHFVNALNEAGRDADVIRMFGEGQGFLATHKCAQAFQTGLIALAVGVVDMIAINFDWFDGVICTFVGGVILYKLKATSEKLFSSSSLVSYWRWGVGKDGEIGSRAEENEDPFDLRVPMERVAMKTKISNRLFKMIRGEDVLDEHDRFVLEREHKESNMRMSYLKKRDALMSPTSSGKFKSFSFESGKGSECGGEGNKDGIDSLKDRMDYDERLQATLLQHEGGFSNATLGNFGSPLGS